MHNIQVLKLHFSCSKYMVLLSQAGVANAFNPNTWEAEADGSLSSRPAWSTMAVPRQPRLHRETLSQQNKQKKNLVPEITICIISHLENLAPEVALGIISHHLALFPTTLNLLDLPSVKSSPNLSPECSPFLRSPPQTIQVHLKYSSGVSNVTQ